MSRLPPKPLAAGRPGQGLGDDLQAEACGISPAAGGVPHEAHEGLALPLREIREESNQVSEIGGHPKWSGIWPGIPRLQYLPRILQEFDSPWGYSLQWRTPRFPAKKRRDGVFF